MIIKTKLYPPKPNSTLVSRPHLSKKLDEGLTGKLTLVSAPAGYGKTTLVAEWVTGLDIPVAWVSLDAWDRDLLRFWRYTFAALKQAVPAFDEQAVLRFATAVHSGEGLIAALINQLQRLAETVVLVWDDFHQVDEPALVQGIDYLLEHLPDHVHVYILSRTQPSLAVAKMRTEPLLHELGREDLRFSNPEIVDFFHQNQTSLLSKKEMNMLIQQTEGWIAGLRLAALYFNGQNGEVLGDLERLGEYRNIADYFIEEVFRHQSQEMQHFLLSTVLLERMNGALCEAMSGMADSQTYLQQLEQTNCFLVPLDDQREWYRYHHLFHDFLRAKAKEYPPEQVQAGHRQAGQWLETHDYWEEALGHYLAGAYYSEALGLLEKLLPVLLRTGLGTLRYWFAQIPDTVLFEHPTLLMSDIFSLFLLGDAAIAQQKLQVALNKWDDEQKASSEVELDSLRGGLMMLQLLGLLFAREFEAAVHHSAEYVRSYPAGDALSSLMSSLGTEGDFDVPDWSLLETVRNLQERTNITRRFLEIWSKSSDYYLYTEFSLGYGDIMYELNRLDEAHYYWQQAKQLGEMQRNRIIVTVCMLKIAQGYAAQGQQAQAEETLAELNEQMDRRQYPRLVHFAHVYQAYLRLQWGEAELAAWHFKHDYLQVTDEIPSTMLLEYYVFACLLAEQDQSSEALELLQRLTYVAGRSERMSETIRLLVKQSILLFAEGEHVQSMDVLEEALALAESDGYLRTVLDGGRPFIVLLQTYLETRQKRHRRPKMKVSLPYVKRLLKLYANGREASQALGVVHVQAIHLTEKEKLVLQWMATDLANKEIAAQLGVSLNTVKTHIHHIYGKLHVSNRLAALERAKSLNLLSPTPKLDNETE